MKMVQAIVRPEKEDDVIAGLEKAGFYPYTRNIVFGRGRQGGIQVGTVRHEEIGKVWLMMAVQDDQVERVVDTIKIAARTGNAGDGKIFISALTDAGAIQISTISQTAGADHE